MYIKLFRERTIGDLKAEFSNWFPFLKLEFFTHKHRGREASHMQYRIHDNVLLLEIGSLLREGVFSFNPSDSVNEFEQRLQRDFGLPVQVFRKTGAVWIETVQTDNLSLQTQNDMAEAACKPVRFNLNSLFL